MYFYKASHSGIVKLYSRLVGKGAKANLLSSCMDSVVGVREQDDKLNELTTKQGVLIEVSVSPCS